MRSLPNGLIRIGVLLTALLPAAADEGMWTFNSFPAAQVKERYGWAPSAAWLEHVRLSSARVGNLGSGSFVSPDGLLLTNHHVATDCIQELSSAEHDYLHNGFTAARREQEISCPNLELNVLMTIQEVTGEVNAEVTPDLDAPARLAAQRRAMARLEKECVEQTGLRCQVVIL